MKKYCLTIYNQSYFLEDSEIIVGLNKDGVLTFNDVITKYIQLTKIKEHYYLYSFVSDLQINHKNEPIEKSYLLKHNDVIQIKNFIIHFKELTSQRLAVIKNFEHLNVLNKKYDLCYADSEDEHYNIIFAISKTSKQPVMIKAISPDTRDVVVTNEFRRECRLVKKMIFLQHPNLLKVFDVEQSMFPRYYITDYVETKSIRSFISAHKKFHWLDALKIIEQIASALSYLFTTLEILHRNVSPDSISLTDNKEVKISNLGAMKSTQLIDLTSRGAVKGSLLFTDPNVSSGKEEYCIQSDMYSLGLLFVYMTTGNNPLNSIDDIVKFDISSVSIKNAKLKNLLMSLLHKDKTKRFQNYDTLIENVKDFYPKNIETPVIHVSEKTEADNVSVKEHSTRTQRIKITSRTNGTINDIAEYSNALKTEDNHADDPERQVLNSKNNPKREKEMQDLLLMCHEIKQNQEKIIMTLNKLLKN